MNAALEVRLRARAKPPRPVRFAGPSDGWGPRPSAWLMSSPWPEYHPDHGVVECDAREIWEEEGGRVIMALWGHEWAAVAAMASAAQALRSARASMHLAAQAMRGHP